MAVVSRLHALRYSPTDLIVRPFRVLWLRRCIRLEERGAAVLESQLSESMSKLSADRDDCRRRADNYRAELALLEGTEE